MKSKKNIYFEISERKVLLRAFDLVFVYFTLHLVSNFLKFEYFQVSGQSFWWVFVLGFYLMLFGTVFQAYHLPVASNQFQTIKSITLTTSFTVLFYLLTPILTPSLPNNRMQIVIFYFSILFGLLLWRILYVKFLASQRFVKKVLLVCDTDQAEQLTNDIQKVDPHFHIVAYLHTDKYELDFEDLKKYPWISISDLDQFVTKNYLSEIVIASQKTEFISADLYHYLIKYLEKGIIIREYTQLYEDMVQRIPVHYLNKDFYKYFPFSRSNQNQLYLLFIRFVDVLASILGLLLMLLILPIILIGNLLGNKGPLFYAQERVGKNGQSFTIFKFRTMVKDAEKDGAVFAAKNDYRVTKFGKFLRKSRLDELPQFWNILINDMSLIGPRPERPIFVEQIANTMPFYETRHIIKPGLTGWAQVNYSYGDSLEDSLIKLQYDLFYIKHRNVFLDINILIKTLSTVLFYKGQ